MPARPGTLRKSAEFREVLEGGTRLGGERMVVYVRPSGQATRAGFVCARHVGGAVARNRARRVLREAWRAVAPGVRPGYDVVFAARPAIGGAKTVDLMNEMVHTLRAAGVMTP